MYSNNLQIIDFEKKGNIVRFYLGDNNIDYFGDDWNDRPYECNAGEVYKEFVESSIDVFYNFDDYVLEPCDGVCNSGYSKDDMKSRQVPCIIIVPSKITSTVGWHDNDFEYWNQQKSKNITRIYYGDTIDNALEASVFHTT